MQQSATLNLQHLVIFDVHPILRWGLVLSRLSIFLKSLCGVRMSLSLMLLASFFVAGSARDISDVSGILSDLKTAATKIPDAKDFEVAYQQYAELLAPVMLLSNGLNFEVHTHPLDLYFQHLSDLGQLPQLLCCQYFGQAVPESVLRGKEVGVPARSHKFSNGVNWVVCCAQRADQAIADLFTSIANQLAGIGEVITGKAEPQVIRNLCPC